MAFVQPRTSAELYEVLIPLAKQAASKLAQQGKVAERHAKASAIKATEARQLKSDIRQLTQTISHMEQVKAALETDLDNSRMNESAYLDQRDQVAQMYDQLLELFNRLNTTATETSAILAIASGTVDAIRQASNQQLLDVGALIGPGSSAIMVELSNRMVAINAQNNINPNISTYALPTCAICLDSNRPCCITYQCGHMVCKSCEATMSKCGNCHRSVPVSNDQCACGAAAPIRRCPMCRQHIAMAVEVLGVERFAGAGAVV